MQAAFEPLLHLLVNGSSFDIRIFINNDYESRLGHIAFTVDDVPTIVQQVLSHGGSLLGKITKNTVPGVGLLTFVYCHYPEGNIIEIQS